MSKKLEDGDFKKNIISYNYSDDSDVDIDIIIEINDDFYNINESDDSDDDGSDDSGDDGSDDIDKSDRVVLSKHKVEGKHSLKYDSIFKGKKEEPLDEDVMDNFTDYHNDTIEVDKSSHYHFESIDNEIYVKSKQVKEKVYIILNKYTDINFLNNRRKPSRVDFNNYYQLLNTHLKDENFTNIELFNELSVYFSDNLFNMFKLLDNEWRNSIINELQSHIGKNVNSKEITNRNIFEETEIEFMWNDGCEDKIITGIVISTDYNKSLFKVDSYENIYEVELSDIIKILNNTKFKYNLNKLNNIDFL